MYHVWKWLSSERRNVRSREAAVSHKRQLVPSERQLEHMLIFRVGWIQFIHIHPKNIMQHIAEEVVGEEQAQAIFISLHWELYQEAGNWEVVIKVVLSPLSVVTFTMSLLVGHCLSLLSPPLPTENERYYCNCLLPSDTLKGGTYRAGYINDICSVCP